MITTEIRVKIHEFGKLISSTEKSMEQFKNMVKALATARDKFDKNLRINGYN